MPVFINDPDAFERLTRVEGAQWAEDDERMWTLYRSAQSFRAFLTAWTAGRAAYGDAWKFTAEKDLTTLYGEAGYARYEVLDATGEIVLIGSSTRAEKHAKARAEGFSVRL